MGTQHKAKSERKTRRSLRFPAFVEAVFHKLPLRVVTSALPGIPVRPSVTGLRRGDGGDPSIDIGLTRLAWVTGSSHGSHAVLSLDVLSPRLQKRQRSHCDCTQRPCATRRGVVRRFRLNVNYQLRAAVLARNLRRHRACATILLWPFLGSKLRCAAARRSLTSPWSHRPTWTGQTLIQRSDGGRETASAHGAIFFQAIMRRSRRSNIEISQSVPKQSSMSLFFASVAAAPNLA